jgi:Xaa-Pro dipeptidase
MDIFEHRRKRFQQLLAAAEIDLAVIGPTANMRYLIGGSPFGDERFCALFVDETGARVAVPKINAETAAGFTGLPLYPWGDGEGPGEAIGACFGSRGKIGRVGIDGSMRADFLLALFEHGGLDPAPHETPGRIVPIAPVLAALRRSKSEEEIEALAKAALQADEVVRMTIEAIEPGVTEKRLAWEAEKAFRVLGADSVSFTLIGFGEHSARPHHSVGEKRLSHGECVIIDVGAALGGYQSDITRMAFLGEPSEEFLEVYAVVLDANEAGRSAVKPGVPLGEVDRAAREVIEKAGYGECFIHRTGHGIGLDVHEEPWVKEGNPEPLEKGMVFSVEPGIYLPGKYGIRIEDIVAVTDTGVKILTGSGRGLAVVKKD